MVQEIRDQIDELRQDMLARMHGVATSGAILLGRIAAIDAESDAELDNGKESIPFSRENPLDAVPYLRSAFGSIQRSVEGLKDCLVAGNDSPFLRRTRNTAAEDIVVSYISKFAAFLDRRSNAEKRQIEDVLIAPTEAKAAGWLSKSTSTSLRADLETARAGLGSLGEARAASHFGRRIKSRLCAQPFGCGGRY